MSVFRPKLWTSLSAAVLLAACGGGEGEAGEAGAATTPAPTATAGGEGEGEAGGGEGEGGAATGETGANGAFNTVPEASRNALRHAHVGGFLLAAQAVETAQGADYASALVGQGLLEAYEPAKAAFDTLGVDEALLRKAAETGSAADLSAALATLDAARAKAGGDSAAVVKGMTDIASGLYGEVLIDGGVDAVEYQHAYGAALSAREVAREAGLTAALPELDKLVQLWPTVQAPTEAVKATPTGQVLAQASRVELAL